MPAVYDEAGGDVLVFGGSSRTRGTVIVLSTE
jgi:hypothetical protein